MFCSVVVVLVEEASDRPSMGTGRATLVCLRRLSRVLPWVKPLTLNLRLILVFCLWEVRWIEKDGPFDPCLLGPQLEMPD